jgi:DNA-binding GntR family transcriptional regulator
VARVEDPALETLTDRVAAELRESILSRRLEPDAPIRQEKLAEELGMSRIPVREALRRLESEGLVVIRPNSGARVAVLDYAGCVEIYKIRERLEPLAFSESVPHLTDEQIVGILEFSSRLPGMAVDIGLWLEEDRRFHLATYAGATPRLRQMIEGFWNSTQHYRRLLVTNWTPEDWESTALEHHLIATAITEQNLRGGEDVVRLHLERARMHLARDRSLFDEA